jgi:hypothetical protein
MRKFILTILFLSFAIPCFAELYVIYDKTTKEVYSVSEKDDTTVPANYEKKIMKGNLSDFTDENPTNYKLSNNKFVKNIDKIDKQEREKIKQGEMVVEEKLIQDKIRKMAVEKLKEEGIILKHN